MSKRILTTLSVLGLLAIAATVLTLAGCGGGTTSDAVTNKRDPEPKVEVTAEAKSEGGEKKVVKTGGTGEAYDAAKATCTIKGVVSFEGKAPKMSLVPVSEQVCKEHHGEKGLKKEDLVVSDDNKVANVIVYVSEGYSGFNFDNFQLPPAHINQEGCQYLPHVLAMKVDQKLEIESSDPVTHNIHGVPKENTEFNISQSAKGIHATKPSFGTPEMGITIKCDVHGWMKAWVCVFEHPFFAVTKADGTFEIKVPPGKYTVTTWQEQLPLKKVIASAPVKVEVTADKPAEANFTYKSK